ncbi:hypothetical protein HYN59_06815 [Flavobacterium album]|uniref:Uncharacterized protein n=1 Tax=Flavobacterium album TaxID=2175091 RepID=A0A2S1QWS8_9FLAO|nr:hypothetical protein [Flavobacterium album]AWH84855.1 hypothetical protein HYN59_06815 [Flavobacterium album]
MKNKLFLLSAIAALAFTTYSCKGDKAKEGTETEAATEAPAAEDKPLVGSEFVDLDLSGEGIPIILKAPKDAKIIKSTTEGELFVYGGKRFKLTVSKNEGTAEEAVGNIKVLSTDKELNPSFDKLVDDKPTAFMKADTKGKLSFTVGITTGESSVIIQEGMGFDQSPDQFTDYTNDDINLMYDAANTAVAK